MLNNTPISMSLEPSQPVAAEWPPTFPAVALRVLEMFSREDVAIAEIAATLMDDPALTAKILKVANSPLYCGTAQITSLHHAVSWLGKTKAAALALSFTLADFGTSNQQHKNYFRDAWLQSFIQGIAMDHLAKISSKLKADEAYIAGVLMDIGRLVLGNRHPQEMAAVMARTVDDQGDLHVIEHEVLGASHNLLGSEMLRALNLPKPLIEVAQYHCLTGEQIRQLQDLEAPHLVAAASVASATGDFYCRSNQGDALARIEHTTREWFDFTPANLEWYLAAVRDDAQAKASMFSADMSRMPPTSTLLGRAVEQLAKTLLSSPAAESSEGETASLVKENKSLRARLSDLADKACRDSLTNVYNREYFSGRLEQRIRDCQRQDQEFALLVLDVDKFKQINDCFGHLAGDHAIKTVAEKISAEVGDSGVVARFGGDEFVILLYEQSREELEDVGLRICRLVSGEAHQCHGADFGLSISIGGVVARPDSSDSYLEKKLFAVADRALYQSKDRGGNTISIAKWPMDDSDTKPALRPHGLE